MSAAESVQLLTSARSTSSLSQPPPNPRKFRSSEGGFMRKTCVPFFSVFCLILAIAMTLSGRSPRLQEQSSAPATTRPSDGYTVHVTAPHLVDGHQMGPYHHYCKVIEGSPQ